MKKLNKYIFLLIIGLFFSGCQSFLELTPESIYSVAGAYKTQNDFEQSIAGIYAQQQGLYSSNASWLRQTIIRSDETIRSAGSADGIDNFTDTPNNTLTTGPWSSYWKIISYSNLILEKIDAASFTDENLKAHIRGEAYFFRGHAYWNLATIFGGMPLIDKTLSINETKEVARSTQAETLEFAAKDYATSIGLLPLTWPSAKLGRVTKYAAEGMLARLHLFQSNFTDAKPLLADVIASGKYEMEETYVHCFTDSHDNGKERVLEVQFTGGQTGEGQAFASGFLPEGFNNKAVMPFSGYSTAMRISNSFYRAYEAGDVRKNLSILKGWTTLAGAKDTVSLFNIKYTHYDAYTPQEPKDWANNIPVLRYTDVKMMYAEVLNEEAYIASGEAFNILNAVRKRAGLKALTSTDLPDQVTFRNALRKERRVEFAFEGLRWFDLVRWGIAVETMNLFFKELEQGKGVYSMKPYQHIMAIPFVEISRYNDSSVMWQNEGY